MSEWLKTGEMIDRLKVGEVALNERGSKVTKILNGNIIWKGSSKVIEMMEPTLNVKWRIIPKPIEYVTFERAMKALRSGKTVTYHDEHKEGYTFDLEKHWNLDEVADYTMEELFKERWTIEG